MAYMWLHPNVKVKSQSQNIQMIVKYQGHIQYEGQGKKSRSNFHFQCHLVVHTCFKNISDFHVYQTQSHDLQTR